MKPDWQNKSFAKGGAATGPSTMHSKLKVGMSSLHSKIGAANSNMPQAPKPVVRKFADGGAVRTRSDDEIGDTDPRTGKVDPGSYDRRMKAGEENMARLSSAADTLKSFFSSKEAPASASNITGDSGMSASDMAKKQAMSGGAQMPAAEPEKTRKIEDYMAKAPEAEGADYGNEGRRTSMASAPTPAKAKPAAKPSKVEPAANVNYGNEDRRTPMATTKAEAPTKPTKKTYRSVSGKIETYEPEPEKPANQRWGVQNVIPNAKRYAGAVADYVKNFETPAERRSRERKEGK
jgi:hypothetical protein